MSGEAGLGGIHHDGLPRNEPQKLSDIVVPLMATGLDQVVEIEGARVSLALDARAQDDCAAYDVEGKCTIVFGSDYVRGPKFSLYEKGYLGNYDIGWYLAGANLSDIAAMGALPLGLLSVIRYPRDLPDEEFGQILEGIRDCCASVGARNVGGDIGSAERIILSASAFGVVEQSRMLTRSSAKAGDVVVLTGPTGMAGAAMKLAQGSLETSLTGEHLDHLLRKWRRVEPRVAHGRIFVSVDGVSACIDTSDGLKASIEALAASSHAQIEIDPEAIPVDRIVAEAAALLNVGPMEIVFGDSVDFELVATVAPEALSELTHACARNGLALYPIGVVKDGSGVAMRASFDRGLPGEAWEHGNESAWQ